MFSKEPLYPIKLFLKKRPVLILLLTAISLNIGNWVWLLLRIRPTEDLVFLHYNILFGADLLGQWYEVYVNPLVGLLIITVNLILGWVAFGKDRFVVYISLSVAIFVQILLLIASALLIFLNT